MSDGKDTVGEEGFFHSRITTSELDDICSLILLGFKKESGIVTEYYVAWYDPQYQGGTKQKGTRLAKELFTARIDSERRFPPFAVGVYTSQFHISTTSLGEFHYATLHNCPASTQSYREVTEEFLKTMPRGGVKGGKQLIRGNTVKELADRVAKDLMQHQRNGAFNDEQPSTMPYGRFGELLAQIDIPKWQLLYIEDYIQRNQRPQRPLYRLIDLIFGHDDLRTYVPTSIDFVLEEHGANILNIQLLTDVFERS